MKKWKQLTPSEFKNIKLLQQAGLSASKVGKLQGRASGTINRIYQADTLDQYRSKIRADKAKSVANQAGATKTPEQVFLPKAPDQTNFKNVLGLQERIAVANERQADALERLCTAWENAPTKKRLF